MKGKNWREYEPQRQPRTTREERSRRRKRKGGLFKKIKWAILLFAIGYFGFMVYYTMGKPYTIALDACSFCSGVRRAFREE